MKTLDARTSLREELRRIVNVRRGVPMAPLGIVLLATGAACGGSSMPPSNAATFGHTSTAPAAATAPPGGPVPAELQRTWAEVGSPIDAHLTLGAHTYTATRTRGSATGAVVVNGDEIDFFNGSVCNLPLPRGVGRYRWALSDDGTLHFTPISADSCGRSQVLANADYRSS